MTLSQKLWFRLFYHSEICDLQIGSSELKEPLKQDFMCCFPYFWVVKQKIDALVQDSTFGIDGKWILKLSANMYVNVNNFCMWVITLSACVSMPSHCRYD